MVIAGVVAGTSGLGLIVWLGNGWTVFGAIALGAICLLSCLVVWGGGISLVSDCRLRKMHSTTR